MTQLPPPQSPDSFETRVNPSPRRSPFQTVMKVLFITMLIIVGLVLLAVGLCFAYFFGMH